MSNITNLNRDYLIKINVKEATIDVPKMTFWNTDKKTSNMFVQLVINMSTNELISQYVTVQNATDYKITLNVIKPKTKQYKTIEATLLNEEKALFEIDLPDEFTDQVGDYSFEFEVSSKVDSNDESITTSNGTYKVNGSILTNLNEETSSSPDLPILKQLIEQVKSLQGGDLTGYQKKNDAAQKTIVEDGKLYLTKLDGTKLDDGTTLPTGSGTSIDDTNTTTDKTWSSSKIDSQFKDIANKFTTEQTDNNFILKYGDKIIATIPINGTLVNYGSIVISCNEILEINEGETLDIEVYLSSKPTNNQSIVITTSNSNITTSVSELTFTPNNYATSQIITLTAIHDVSSFDDKNCLVTFASENVENITITVTIKNTDVQQSHYITDGLSLYYDFTETPTNPTTVYDKINNLSIYNSGYTSDSYTDNGVYLVNGGGANAFKMGSSSVSYSAYQTMPEFDDFLNKLKEGNGLTVEYFGQYIPMYVLYAYNTGLELSGTYSVSGGYLANFGSTGSATLMYLNTSDESTKIKLNQVNSVTKDGSTITAFSADNKADTYIHLVITGDESGTLTWYLNGNPMTNTTTASDFKAWDYDTMFKSSYIMVNRAGSEDTNRLIYPATSIKIYNRALSQEEIQTNLEYEVSRTNFIESASVTP